jgi:uncharacterized protein (DUF1810 family)
VQIAPELAPSLPCAIIRGEAKGGVIVTGAASRGSEDSHDLQRFLTAQATVIDQVMGELRRGRKASHWMWFVFPQIAGLGTSETARHFAIASLAEARAYRAHDVLGQRLLTCTRLVNQVEGRTAREIFGTPDDMKFRSCMTLFALATPSDSAFGEAIDHYFAGEADPRTLDLAAR